MFVQYQNNPHVLIDRTGIEWLQSMIGEIEYRINEGMKIYCDYINGIISKDDAIERLIAFIEKLGIGFSDWLFLVDPARFEQVKDAKIKGIDFIYNTPPDRYSISPSCVRAS